MINYGEFQEYLCRLAQIRTPDPQITLYDKIYTVLNEILKLIGEMPVHPSNDDIGDSESDYDDFDID